MARRKTKEELIQKARSVHGDKYRYDLVAEYRNVDRVPIICQQHGIFIQRVSDHLAGCGCKKCYKPTHKYTTEEFIEKGTKIYNGWYDYSEVSIVRVTDKTIVKCPKHGKFETTYERHIKLQSGCIKCRDKKLRKHFAFTLDKCLSRFTETHGDRFDYSLVEYVNNQTPVKIRCKKHDTVFTQTPASHWNGSIGCKLCRFEPSPPKVDMDVLKDLYQNKNMTTTEIGERFGVSYATIGNWMKYYNIPRDNTYIISTSSHERELSEFLTKYGIYHKTGEKSIISPYELDIYIPEHKIAIEVNGCYYHSEIKKDKNYHLNKTKLCQEKGIQLLHIWDYEMINKKEIVRSMLLNKFGKTERNIYARKCTIVEVQAQRANKFLNECHIQGKARSTVKLALVHNDELVALMTMLRQKDGTWYMSRYCNALNTTVVGGFSKLLKAFHKEHPEEIITHANLRFGTGNVYEVNGFEFVKQTKPTPWWFHKNDRNNLFHHSHFRKYKQHKLLEHFDPSLSEIENMHNNGFLRVYDCGHKVFKWRP